MSVSKSCNKIVGNQGEDLAADFCQQHGYEIITRNYRCRAGEIDIIARKDDVIHFIEVKNRRRDLVPGRYAVNTSKQKHLRQVAQYFLMNNKLSYTCLTSFDVIEITAGQIEFLENCFY